MKKKMLTYAIIPVLGLSAIVGVSAASAHGLLGGFGNATPDEIAARHQTMFQSEASLLGISVDEVKAAWAEGKSIKELAEAHGISQEQLQQKMKDARLQQMKTQLQGLVEKSVITQAQADMRLTAMQNRAEAGGKMGIRFHRF